MAQTYRCRPSELLDIDDPVDAYRFDRAVLTFGSALDAELEKAKGKTDKARSASRERIVQKWIPEARGKTQASGFKDPGASASKL